jgi:hypothetical protein
VRHCCPRYALWAHKPRQNGRPPHESWCMNRARPKSVWLY